MVTRFLRKPHPTASMIKALRFKRLPVRIQNDEGGYHETTILLVMGDTLRTSCTRERLYFKYSHTTGEVYVEESDDDFEIVFSPF
jgi:hypothetical protein